MCLSAFTLSPVKYVGLQNLIQRNEQLYGSGNAPSGGVALPFILVQVHIPDYHFTVDEGLTKGLVNCAFG